MTPKPAKKAPATQIALGTMIRPQLRSMLRCRSTDTSRSCRSLGQALLHEDDVRRVGGDRRGAAQRNRHVGLLQGDRVVDPVADEADLPPFLLQQFDVFGLVRREHVREVAVHPELLGQLARRAFVIARDDGEVLDAALAQPCDDVAGLRAGWRPAVRSRRPARSSTATRMSEFPSPCTLSVSQNAASPAGEFPHAS